MRKISPVGFSLAKILIGLFIAELLLAGVGKLLSRSPMHAPPPELGDWAASPTIGPISDYQRDNPVQISILYTQPDQPVVHVDYALVQSATNLRQPSKYLPDSDGRVNLRQTNVAMKGTRVAYTVSLIRGFETNLVDVHWFQRPGGQPVPTAGDATPDVLKSVLTRLPRLYQCDVWEEVLPSSYGPDVTKQLQGLADALSDRLKRDG